MPEHDKPEERTARPASEAGWRKHLQESAAWQMLAREYGAKVEGNAVTADLRGRDAQRVASAAISILEAHGYTVKVNYVPEMRVEVEG